jgi:hypothetical protein
VSMTRSIMVTATEARRSGRGRRQMVAISCIICLCYSTHVTPTSFVSLLYKQVADCSS